MNDCARDISSEEYDFDPVAYINDPTWHSSVYGLERIEALLSRMGRPQDSLRFVHVAGTNGKGSTCSFIAQILQDAGYKVGLFTSPYLIVFEERIRVNGVMISQSELKDVTLFVREHTEALARETGEHATEFELMTAVALEHFARSQCDIAVLEVGLGGLLDSTNVIPAPEVCAIARIGLDHTELLGTTMGEIAAQKAGIIKAGAAVVSYPQDDEAATEAIARAAQEAGASSLCTPDFSQLSIGGLSLGGMRQFTYQGSAYETSLLGSYQPYNAAMAIECARALRDRGWAITEETIASGIAHTRWEGRFEVVESAPDRPTIIVDGGHNPQGATVLASSLQNLYPTVKPLFIMGVLADKDYRGMLDVVVDRARGFLCVTPPNPRALSANELAQVIQAIAEKRGLVLESGVIAMESMRDAVLKARSLVGAGDVICAFGSLYSIADVKAALRETAEPSA